jgi:predicted double-glycine peptidase
VNILVAEASEVRINTGFGGYLSKDVVSIKERKFKNIVHQQYDFSCGAASLATLLKYGYKVEGINEADLVKEMIEKGDPKQIREKGFSLLDLKKMAERKGFQSNGYKVKAENLTKLKIPVIILLNTKGYKHFVILKGIKNERAYFADPAFGNRSIPFKDFVESWDEAVLVVYKKTEKGILLEIDTDFQAPTDSVVRLLGLGLRNYVRLPGEF